MCTASNEESVVRSESEGPKICSSIILKTLSKRKRLSTSSLSGLSPLERFSPPAVMRKPISRVPSALRRMTMRGPMRSSLRTSTEPENSALPFTPTEARGACASMRPPSSSSLRLCRRKAGWPVTSSSSRMIPSMRTFSPLPFMLALMACSTCRSRKESDIGPLDRRHHSHPAATARDTIRARRRTDVSLMSLRVTFLRSLTTSRLHAGHRTCRNMGRLTPPLGLHYVVDTVAGRRPIHHTVPMVSAS